MTSSVPFRIRSRRSRARRRRLVVAFAAVALLLAAAALVLHGARSSVPLPQAPRALTDPPLARRGVAAAWDAGSRRELQTAVRAALAPATDGAADWSAAIVAQDGRVLYDDRSTHAVEPASVEKLIVSDAALSELGSDFRFDTLIGAMQPPRNGTIPGDLWLAGSGDPSLRSGDLRAGAAALRQSGIDSVAGRLMVDAGAIAGEEINPYWNADDANEDFMAATSGISLDEDTVEFQVTGTVPGENARVRVLPRSAPVTYAGQVITGGGDDVIVAAMATPNDFRVDGDVPPGVRERFWVPVHGIARYAGSVFDGMLRASGVAVQAPPGTGTVPLGAHILWEHRSMPLWRLVRHMLIVSDNHFAEQLMRMLGGSGGGATTDRNGIAQEIAVLRRQAIPIPGLHLVDGSGLAHANRVSAITLARILAHFDADPRGNRLYPLLPRGGLDGTLKPYHFTAAPGRVRAKSGHVDGASALAGYVETRTHGRVVFAFLINGSPGDPDAAIVSAVDRIAAR